MKVIGAERQRSGSLRLRAGTTTKNGLVLLLLIYGTLSLTHASAQRKKLSTQLTAIEKRIEILERLYIVMEKENKGLRTQNSALKDSIFVIRNHYIDLKTQIRYQAQMNMRIASMNSALRVSFDSMRRTMTGKIPVSGKSALPESASQLVLPVKSNAPSYESYEEPMRQRRYRETQRTYYTGPRGGCYYYGGTGRKVYVDQSLCR